MRNVVNVKGHLLVGRKASTFGLKRRDIDLVSS